MLPQILLTLITFLKSSSKTGSGWTFSKLKMILEKYMDVNL